MDMSIIVVVWVVVMIIQNIFDNKKRPPQPPPNSEIPPEFEIPTLANDPNFPNEEPIILIEDTTQAAEVREVDFNELYRQKKLAAQTAAQNFSPQVQNKIPEVEQKKFTLDLTPSATVNAIILGEILSKPKFKK